MLIVSDTSPLLNLAIIDELRLVREQFEEVEIPPAVFEELRTEEMRPGSEVLREAVDEGWISVREVANEPLARALRRDLDRGEAEAIALAVEVEASRILLDEREGRQRARRLDLHVTGVLGILARAHRQRVLHTPLEEALQRLKVEAGFWIAPALERKILREAR